MLAEYIRDDIHIQKYNMNSIPTYDGRNLVHFESDMHGNLTAVVHVRAIHEFCVIKYAEIMNLNKCDWSTLHQTSFKWDFEDRRLGLEKVLAFRSIPYSELIWELQVPKNCIKYRCTFNDE